MNKSQILTKQLFHTSLSRWLIHLAIWITCLNIVGIKKQYADSAGYLQYFPTFFYTHKKLDILNYRDTLRGYSMPLIGLLIQRSSDWLNISELRIVLWLNIFLFTFVTAMLVPLLAKRIYPNSSSGIVSAVAVVFLIALWRGYGPYFLTDIPSAALFIASLCIILKNKISGWNYFFLGLSLSLAINLRPAYLYATLLIISILIVKQFYVYRSHGFFKALLGLSVCLLGFMLIATPQAIINYNQDSTINILPKGQYYMSPLFYTTVGTIPVGNQDLSTFQASVGIGLQKFEVSGVKNTDPRVAYEEPLGKEIINKDLPIYSMKDYSKIWLNHPIAMTKIITRHGLNGFDQRYSYAYIQNFDQQEKNAAYIWYAFLGLTILCIFLNFTLKENKRYRNNLIIILAASLLVIAPAIIGAVETRFFILPSLIAIALTSGYLSSHGYKLFKNYKILVPTIICLLALSYSYSKYSNWVYSNRGPTNCTDKYNCVEVKPSR